MFLSCFEATQRTQPFFLATQIFQVQATQFIQTQYQPTMINDIDDEPIVPTFLITDNFEWYVISMHFLKFIN